MANLYVVATPIGNLKDITFRAIEVLKTVDLILCEDTRRTSKILSFYEINVALSSYHQHTNDFKTDKILSLLEQGKNIALVSDAGTPGISDPGGMLIERVVGELKDKVNVIPIPGPSALISAASVSGISMDRFIFLGFPPVKNKRNKFFEELSCYKYPVIFYESCHRIIKTIKDLNVFCEDRDLIVFREITKKFETVYRGKPKNILETMKLNEIKGEFTVIIDSKNEK